MGSSSENKPLDIVTTYIVMPQWAFLFFIIGGAFLLVLGLSVRVLFDLSAASDRVFAIEALLSGISADWIFRGVLRRKLVIAPKVEIPVIYVWPLLCLYVYLLQPFE